MARRRVIHAQVATMDSAWKEKSTPKYAGHAEVRLLIPIDATLESLWSLHYARRRARSDGSIAVFLLYVAEPVRQWEVLRFRTESEIRQHFLARAQVFLEEAAGHLRKADIEVQTYFREADPILGVLSLAEELECTEIVAPKPEWLGLFSDGIGRKLLRAANHIPVMLVNSDGMIDT